MKEKLRKQKYKISILFVFILVSLFLAPLFDGYSIFQLIGVDDDSDKQTPLSADPENWWIYKDLEPNEIFAVPTFNWSKFWQVFKNHAMWSLEGWNPNTEEWEFANDSLTINRTFTDDNSVKLALIFDAPAPITTDYRLTLAIDYKLKSYIHKVDKYTYNLSFEVHNESFNVSYNFSDIASIPGVIITHGVKGINGKEYFWFRARRNDVPPDTHIELDPTYTVYSETNTYTYYTNARRLVRQSNGTLWCGFHAESDAHVAFSEDEGVTWTDIEVWGDEFSGYPSIAVDSNDVVHYVFVSNKDDSNDQQLDYSNSTQWSTITQIRDEDKFHTFPSLAIDSNDNLHIVYEKGEEGTSNDDQVAYINSTDNGGSWGTEQILTDEADISDDAWYPSIAIDSNDVIHVVFTAEDHYTAAGTDDDILHMQSNDYGDTWSGWENNPVYQDPTYNQNSPCIAIDDNDKVHVVWYGISQDTNDQVGYSHNISGTWSTVEWITTETAIDHRYPTISVNDNDYIHSNYEVVATSLNHSVNDTTSWTMDVSLTGNYDYPNMISAQWPVIGGLKTNRPETGFALITTFGNTNVTFRASDDLTWDSGIANTAPTISNPIPVNQSVDSSKWPQIKFDVADVDGDTMSINISENTTGGWRVTQFNVSTDDTIVLENYSNASAYNTEYWWRVNVTDGQGGYINASYNFETGDIPGYNNVPTITGEILVNMTLGAELTPILNVTVFDDDNNDMYINWSENGTGNWRHQQSNLSIANGTSIQWNAYSNASAYSTRYDWRLNVTDGQGGSAEYEFWFITKADPGFNNVPTVAGEIPLNQSTGIELTPIINITIFDDDDNVMYINWSENTTGGWRLQQTNLSVANGTSIQWNDYNNATAYSTRYDWRINISDGQGGTAEFEFWFVTKADPGFNNAPTITGVILANQTLNAGLTPILNLTVHDDDNDKMYINWSENGTGNWRHQQSNLSIANGTSIQWNKYDNATGFLTRYDWRVNITDGQGGYTNASYWFIIRANAVPTITNPVPANGSTGNSRWPQIEFTVADADGDTMTINISENTTGYWLHQQTNVSTDDTIRWENYTNASAYDTEYWWRINITDGQGNYINASFRFFTGSAPGPAFVNITIYFPTNESVDVCLPTSLGVTILSSIGSTMNITFYSNLSTGIWDFFYTGVNSYSIKNVTNGTYYLDPIYMVLYDYTYGWNASVTDGRGNTNYSGIFVFTTATEPCADAVGGGGGGGSSIMGLIGLMGILGLIGWIMNGGKKNERK